MSDDEPKDESTDDSEQQADEQATDSDQPAGQAEQQPAESDQSTEQAEEQAADEQPSEQAAEQPAESDQSAEQSEEQPSEGDQSADQAEKQPVDSDQSAASASVDDTVAFAGDAGSPGSRGGGAGGRGPSKSESQVIAIFMTDNAGRRFREGSIGMMVFDGAKGTLLWKPGTMNQQKELTYQNAATSNTIRSGSLPVSPGNSVKVELRVRLSGPDYTGDKKVKYELAQVDFLTAARFEVPTDGKLTVAVNVETTRKEFTVSAKDEAPAIEAARGMLASQEEIQLAWIDSLVAVEAGRYQVSFLIPTKRLRILQPQPMEVIYP